MYVETQITDNGCRVASPPSILWPACPGCLAGAWPLRQQIIRSVEKACEHNSDEAQGRLAGSFGILRACVCIHTYILCICVCMHACMHACMHVCICVQTYFSKRPLTSMRVCVCTCICTLYIYTQPPSHCEYIYIYVYVGVHNQKLCACVYRCACA